MHNLRLVLLYLLCSCFCPACLLAQAQPSPSTAPSATASSAKPVTPKTPAEFFARARQLSDLIAAGVPFHLKATYVASGDTEFTGNGTFEEWWQWKDLWRKEVTLGDYKYVFVRNGDHEAAFATGPYIPLRLRQAMSFFPLTIADNQGLGGGWNLTKTVEGSQTLNTAVSQNPCFSKDTRFPVCDLRFEFTDDGLLRVRRVNRITTIYNKLLPFDNLLVPRELLVIIGQQLSLTIYVTMLEQLSSADKNIFDSKQQPANLIALPLLPLDQKSLKLAKIQNAKCKNCAPPIYPAGSRNRNIEGTVMTNLSIDQTGKVREPFILISGGSLLDQVTLQAVRQWHFSPLKIDGVPRMTEMSTPENFRLNH
ncbi:MAG: energy transducer TonB [Acidobacteriaceae bacterium]